LVAVVVLILNDHLFKGAGPGWVTGKLSDFAGLVVVATLVAILAGPTWGTVLPGLAFVALKTIPGVAEVAAPMLGGGVTLRDPTDLTALSVLPPLWWIVHRVADRGRSRRGWIAIGLVAGVLATTATSTAPYPDVVLKSGTGVIYASVDPGGGFERVILATTDGGRSWDVVPYASAPPKEEWYWSPNGNNPQACASDGTCYRTRYDARANREGLVVEVLRAGTQWQLDGAIPPTGFHSGIAVDTAAPDRAVITGDNSGAIPEENSRVYWRRAPGDWEPLDLGPLASPPTWQWNAVMILGQIIVATVLTFVLGSVLIWLLVPQLAAKVVLIMAVNSLGCGYLFLWTALGFPLQRLQQHAAWLVILLVVAACVRVYGWLEWRALPSESVSEEAGAETPGPAHGATAE
jgi:hypothetical protein